MQNSLVVRVLKRVGKLPHEAGSPDRRDRALDPQQTVERLAVEQGHRQVMLAVRLANIEHPHDVRVLEGRRQPGLAVKQPQERLIGGEVRLEDFDGARLLEQPVLGTVHEPHAPDPELIAQVVGA